MMIKGQYSFITEIQGHQFDAYAIYEFTRGYVGVSKGGLKIEPDEPDTVSVDKVFVDIESNKKFRELDMPSVVREDIEQEILEELRCAM